jgi:hypothetical protein
MSMMFIAAKARKKAMMMTRGLIGLSLQQDRL